MLFSKLAIANLNTFVYDNIYRAGIVAYAPEYIKFPWQCAYTPGYVRYIDNKGMEALITLIYPKLFYQIKQPITYVKKLNWKLLHRYQNLICIVKPARQTHILIWARQQYQSLQTEIDSLRNAGKQPSQDMNEKRLSLEKITTASNFAKISEH